MQPIARPFVTVTDTPTHRAEPDETQVLFEEARQRRKRRRLHAGITALIVVVMAVGLTIGLLVGQGGSSSPRPVAPTSPAPSTAASATGSFFSIRPALCYAPSYSPSPGGVPPTGPLPACAPSTQLTQSNLGVTPQGGNVNGYSSNSNIDADSQFTSYPSTASSNSKLHQDVLLPGTPGEGGGRYVLGPADLTRSAIAHAHVTFNSGQWAIDLSLTPKGSAQFDRLAEQQFHAILGVVINGQVVSAPITQPTQSSFTSFDGQVQISGAFTQHQAKMLASEL